MELTGGREDRLIELSELLHGWSGRINLTGHRSVDQIVQRLILDALALSIPLPPCRRLVDLGSGAGFPGLPLAILRPEVEVLLVEPRERRNHFQRAAIRQLGLSNVQTSRARIESPDPDRGDGVIAQAVGITSTLVEGMANWCEDGGFLAIPGGVEAPTVPATALLGAAETVPYTVPEAGPSRTLWLARRV